MPDPQDYITARVPDKVTITKRGRGIDYVIAEKALESVAGEGWVDADRLLYGLGKTWQGSSRLSGSIRRVAAILGYHVKEKMIQENGSLRLQINITRIGQT